MQKTPEKQENPALCTCTLNNCEVKTTQGASILQSGGTAPFCGTPHTTGTSFCAWAGAAEYDWCCEHKIFISI